MGTVTCLERKSATHVVVNRRSSVTSMRASRISRLYSRNFPRCLGERLNGNSDLLGEKKRHPRCREQEKQRDQHEGQQDFTLVRAKFPALPRRALEWEQ